MALTKIGSIGINTGIQFAGVTTIATLNASDNVLSVGGTVNFVSDVSIGGTVSIAGTLTYEDVTNVDAVGLITARNGIKVGSGITLSPDGNIFTTGIITASGGVDAIGIMSAGISQATGIITALNFIGTGNTVLYNQATSTVDISIAGGGGGAVGAGTDKVFYENDQTVTQSYSISAGKNAMVAGPIAVASGKTITIPSGSELTIV